MPQIRAARAQWSRRRPPVAPDELRPGDESVWDYPRPPRVEPVVGRVVVEHAGRLVADSVRALRMLETASAPTVYLPPADVATALLVENGRRSLCEWKGFASYLDLRIPDAPAVEDAAWSLAEPLDDLGQGYGAVAGWFSFYAGRVDACRLDGEAVRAQPGGFYGGWVTSRIRGPIKGAPGSGGW